MSFAMIWGLTVAMQHQNQSGIQYKNPPGKDVERKQFHSVENRAMPMSIRLTAWEKRERMLKESIFQQIPWRSVGSEVQGGRVSDIAVPTGQSNWIYIAFATGGLWRTENEGQTWTPLFDNQSSFGIGDIDVSADGKTIWLGSGEANSQRTSYAGTGVFKSTDAGQTWTNVGLHDSHHIGRVVIDRKNPNTVWVAALGPLYSQWGERGVYKTTDGGKTWNKMLEVDHRTGAMDIVLDPRNSNVAYAAMWDRDRRAWNMLESGPGSAIYKTTDGGKTWNKMTGLPSGEAMGRTALAISPSNPDVLYAFVDNQGPDMDQGSYDEGVRSGTLTLTRFLNAPWDVIKQLDNGDLSRFLNGRIPRESKVDDVVKGIKDGSMSADGLKNLILQQNPNALDRDMNNAEIWRTNDGGKTWKKTRPDMGDHGGYYWNEAVVDPNDPDTVYTLGLLVLKSTDGGASWNPIARRNHVDHHSFWIDPKNPNRMLNGNDGGIYVSYDAGDSWNHWNNLSVGQFTTIAVDTATPYNIYGGLQDNGTLKGPSTYRPGFSDINLWDAIGGGDGSFIQVDPRDGGRIVYTASQFGSHSARNQETNERWNARAQGRDLRYNWISPMLISPHHPDIIYLGSQKLHRSFNNGRSYAELSGDLTKNIPNGDVPHSTLTAIAESPFQFGLIYVGADDGSVKYTPDSGLTWKDIATPAPERWVTRLIASTHKKGRIYCTQNGYRQDEWTPYVWASDDNGETWTSIAANLPFEPVNTIREDSTDENILYVGTDMGVYVSLDRGASWMTYGTGIPHTPVHDLVIQDKAEEMVIASHARSVWVVSVKWIHDLSDKIKESKFHEYNLDVPSGRNTWGYERSAAYQDPEARERNIDWSFWVKDANGKGTLSLVGEDGKEAVSKEVMVNKGINFTSLGLLLKAGDPKAPGKKDPKTAEEALADPFEARRAQYVPAGKYKLTLKVGGETFTADVEIR
ncbi:MAG: glycosyl hydrolase [Armatimonadetes bacterium]|nr:glycosyl hydrolase [Armatimonadota bacterium]